MPEELTTRDVFQQVDVRLSRVEEDLRDFRTEVIGRFDRQSGEMNGRFERLQRDLHTTTRWMLGMVLITWLSLMASIWLK